jgi:predicted phage terminase large subunit-like protein
MGAVVPITKEGGKIRVVGTIMHLDSLLENFMPAPKDVDTYTDGLRTYSKKRERPWQSIKYKAHNEDFSLLLWPQQFNKKILLSKRAEYAEIGMLDVYGQEYLNFPIDPTTAFFRKSDFLPMESKHFETKKTYYIGIDLAISEKKRAARTAMIVGGMDSEGFLNIVDVRTDRWDGLQIIEEMFSINTRWKPEVMRIEEENIARALGSVLNREMDERQEYLPIQVGKPTKDKDQRAQAIRARMRAGKVRFDKSAEWYPDLEEELTSYPKHPRVDQLDALAWIGITLEEMIAPPTPQEEEDEEYEQMVEEFGEFGRNVTTGY